MMSGSIRRDDAREWYEEVRRATLALVKIKAISPSADETRVAEAVLRLLREGGREDAYTALGLDALAGDPTGRQNAYALVRGQSRRTVVLLGHIDTVGTADYGRLEADALDPEALERRREELLALTPGLADDLSDPATGQDWLLGRGVNDMKGGVAVNIAILRRLADLARRGQAPLSVVLLATCDEENESAGVLQGVQLLLRLKQQYGLEYVGVINTDYTTSRYPGDPHRYAYTGTIGKLLPSFFIVGREAHVGEPFQGVDANLLAAQLISDLSMNDALCDTLGEQRAPPPVTLHATDLKTHYDVQLPYVAYFYLNVLTLTTTPGELLERLRERARLALLHVMARVGAAERRWSGAPPGDLPLGEVYTYAELLGLAVKKQGEQAVQAALTEEWEQALSGPDGQQRDARERSMLLVQRLWRLSEQPGPLVVLYYSPPYYPHLAKREGALQAAVEAVAAAHPDLCLRVEEFYPFLSDMSYLRLDPSVDLAALTANMPLWQPAEAPARPGAYRLPLEAIRALDAPFVNIGPYGRGAHQRGERVLMSYSFATLPQLICEILEGLAAEHFFKRSV
jgi:arginine utilization protein RocB